MLASAHEAMWDAMGMITPSISFPFIANQEALGGLSPLLKSYLPQVVIRCPFPTTCAEACYEKGCSDYRGCMNYTQTGLPCQRWEDVKMPKSLDSEVGNQCRAPRSTFAPSSIWCYTNRTTKSWDYCQPYLSKLAGKAFINPVKEDAAMYFAPKAEDGIKRLILIWCVWSLLAISLGVCCAIGRLTGPRVEAFATGRCICAHGCFACLSFFAFLVWASSLVKGMKLERCPHAGGLPPGFRHNVLYNPTPVSIDAKVHADIYFANCTEAPQRVVLGADELQHLVSINFVAHVKPESTFLMSNHSTLHIHSLSQPEDKLRWRDLVPTVMNVAAKNKRCLLGRSSRSLLVVQAHVRATVNIGLGEAGNYTVEYEDISHVPFAHKLFLCTRHKIARLYLKCPQDDIYKGRGAPKAMTPLVAKQTYSEGLKIYHNATGHSTKLYVSFGGSMSDAVSRVAMLAILPLLPLQFLISVASARCAMRWTRWCQTDSIQADKQKPFFDGSGIELRYSIPGRLQTTTAGSPLA